MLCNMKMHYGVHNSSPLDPLLSHTNPVHASPSHFLKFNFNIILQHTPRFPSGLFPSDFPTKTMYKPLLSPKRATRPALLIRLDLITRIIFDEESRSLGSKLCSFFSHPRLEPTKCTKLHGRLTDFKLL